MIRVAQATCDALGDEDDTLKREVLTHAGNRWSLGIVHALGAHGKLRHAELGRRLPGVTQRMLTRSLRQLERDGLLSRFDHREVPPRVDYQLTPLGRSFLARMVPLWMWLLEHAEDFRSARARFDETRGAGENPAKPPGSVPVSRTAAPEPVFERGKARDAKFGGPNEPSSNAVSHKKRPRPCGLRGK